MQTIKVGIIAASICPPLSTIDADFPGHMFGCLQVPERAQACTSTKSEANGGFLAFTFATASDMAEVMALVAVANA